jgi:polyhydroxyalkanoate synthesis regulator phasin
MAREDELLKQIENAKKELGVIAENKKNHTVVRRLTDISLDEKVAVFDQLYESTFEIVKTAVRTGYSSEDDPQYLYEEVMQSVLSKKGDGDAFWKYLNGLTN